jgi:Flp pilus assembly protein TadG
MPRIVSSSRVVGTPGPGPLVEAASAQPGKAVSAGRSRRDRGSVTAETAVVLPALVIVLAASLWAVAVVGMRLQCVDAARAGARAAARGEPPDAVRAAVARSAPADAKVDVSSGGEIARVEVSLRIEPPWGPALPAVDVKASAVSALEPGVGP